MLKEAGKGKDGRIRVWFNGELRPLFELAKAERVSTGTAMATWHREGQPGTIDAAFFEGIRSRQYDPNRAKYYSVDGVRYSAKQMVEIFGCNQSTLDYRRATRGKVDYTKAEIEAIVEAKEERKKKESRSWGGRGSVPPWRDVQPPGEAVLMERAMSRFLA